VPEVTVEEKWGGTVGRKNGRAEAVEEKEPEPEQPSSGHAVMGQRPRASSGRATTGHWPRASLGRAGRSIGGGRAGAAELVHGGRALALGEVLRRAVGGLSWAVVSGCVSARPGAWRRCRVQPRRSPPGGYSARLKGLDTQVRALES
jgi:hypothetical protein